MTEETVEHLRKISEAADFLAYLFGALGAQAKQAAESMQAFNDAWEANRGDLRSPVRYLDAD